MRRGELRRFWAKKLFRPKISLQFKVPALSSKPKRRVKKVKWCLPGLYSVAQFLHGLPSNGPLRVIVEKVSQSKFAYIIESTLHVNALQLCTRNELNFISLVTHFHLVEEVRIHTFHLNHYLTSRRAHVCLQSVRWELVKLILCFIERGPWVLQESKKEREIRVTFDEFLKPVIEA